MAHLIGLNNSQRDAVTTDANVVQVLAPPGSGKTKTLTSRVAHLLSHRKYKPWNVICLTFTVKSSREMKERLRKLIGDDIGGKVILGTFHSVCRRYLASYGHLIGVGKGFGVADSSDSQSIVRRIIKGHNMGIDPKQARNRISNCKSKNIGPAQLQQELNGKKQPNDIIDKQELITVFEEYQEELRKSNLLDYDDLLLYCMELLRRFPSCISNVQAVLIDEFQDTNHVQFDLMRFFAQRCNCVTTVGDPDQSIYGWRSAEVANLSKMYEVWPDTSVINLAENYRSTASILAASQLVIEQDTARPQKALAATHRSGTRPVLRLLPNADNEAEYIVREIQRAMTLSADLLNFSDYAILLRFNPLSRKIESALGKAGIPYRMVGGARFFDRIEIKVLLDYLHVIAHPDNSDALSRIINIPARQIGDTTLKGLIDEATGRKCSLWTVLSDSVQGKRSIRCKLTAPQKRGISALTNVILAARKKLEAAEGDCGPKALLELLCKKLDFSDFLEREHPNDHETRWENVEQLMAQADENGQSSTSVADEDILPDVEGVEQQSLPKGLESLVKFLANVALSTETKSEQEQNASRGAPGEAPNCVTISTMHAAKGLEWPIVFVPGCYTGSIPHSRAEDTDEERRILYVAMTRAKAMLYLSVPKRDSGGRETEISSFLQCGKVKAKLADTAPLLDYVAIEDIAAILGRQAPDRSKIKQALGSCANLLDDHWPADGSPNAEDVAKRWTNTGSYKSAREGFKRRKVSGEEIDGELTTKSTSYYSTTMQASQAFTVPPQDAGFTTATRQLQVQRESEKHKEDLRLEQRLEQDTTKSQISPRGSPKKAPKSPKKGKARTVHRSAGQTSLFSFWSGGKKEPAENIVTEAEDDHLETLPTLPAKQFLGGQSKAFLGYGLSARSATVAETAVDLPSLPAAEQPSRPLTEPNRPFQPVVSSTTKPFRRPVILREKSQEADKGHIFLSSSPPPEDASAACVEQENNGPSAVEPARASKPTSTAFKAASSLHHTTVGRFRYGGKPVGTLPASTNPPRRRLGMGGPMKPWRP